ncbi:efflux transporter outer membrane subunit [Pusillimonas sp. TS35]|uniref:efflux transporter outer membrane subunit n=1 Tax=Paracandidimonas lactea TaxID=2895524 RepID=UPI0013681B6F|nr:efflux transporter outer membrane subunit [Paracandidimonas lactea]MYN13908.1 efflux transporter outer membrane subunit [Pusillimonas sp. TS35]
MAFFATEHCIGTRAAAIRTLGAASLLLALAACVNLAPQTEVPPLPVANAWPTDTNANTAQALADLDWSHYFQDAEMRRLIGLALEHNRDLRLAVLRVREAEAAYRIQRSELLPTMGAQGQGVRTRDIAAPIPDQTVTHSKYQAAVGLTSWEIDFWGRIRNLKDAALDDWLATDAARQSVQIALIRQVADAVLSLRELQQRALLAQDAVTNRQQSLDIFEQRRKIGSSSELELTQVRTLLIQAQALSAQIDQERAAAQHALALLVGTDPGLQPVSITLDTTPLGVLQPGLPADVLLARPDIRAAEYQLRAAHARIGAARAAFLPRISLTSSVGTASTDLNNLFESSSRAWLFTPVIEVPIFTAGRLQANLDVAEVRRDMAVATYERNIQTAFREVSDALSSRQGLAKQMEIGARMAQTQAERAALAQLRYDSGAAPYLEVLDAKRDLLIAQQQLVQARSAWLSSQVALFAALGGGADPTSVDLRTSAPKASAPKAGIAN